MAVSMPMSSPTVRVGLVFLALTCVFSVIPRLVCGQAQPGASWPCFGQNSRGTSRSPFTGAQSTTIQLIYSFASGIGTTTGTIAADGTVFVGDTTGILYALDGDSIARGVYKEKWRFVTQSDIVNAPSIGEGGSIYVSTLDRSVYALDPLGGLLWKYMSSSGTSRPLGMGWNGTVIIIGTYEVVALNGRTGTVLWEYIVSGGSQPVFGEDGTLYVPGLDSLMYALDGMTGKLVWKTMMPAEGTSAVVGSAKMVYVGTESRAVVAFNGVTGSIAWQLDLPWNATRYWVTTAAFNNDAGLLYLGTYSGVIAAVDVTQAKLAWSLNVSAYPADYAIGGDGTVYAGTPSAALAVNGTTGAVKWKAEPGGQIMFYPPFIGADGTVYFYSASTMYLFQDSVPSASVTPSSSTTATSTPSTSPSVGEPTPKPHRRRLPISEPITIVIAVGGFVVVVALFWLAYSCYRRRQRRLRQLEFEITLDDVLLQ
jgi:outer membrane protein assembly factor BamB